MFHTLPALINLGSSATDCLLGGRVKMEKPLYSTEKWNEYCIELSDE